MAYGFGRPPAELTLLAALAALALASPAAAMPILGDMVVLESGVVFSEPITADRLTPSIGGIFGPAKLHATPLTFHFPPEIFRVDAASLRMTADSGFFAVDFPFNGFVLFDLSRPITSAILTQSSVPGFTADNVQLRAGAVWVDLAGLTVTQGQSLAIAIDSTVAIVPEPATWAMMMLGFAGLGVAIRARPRVRRV